MRQRLNETEAVAEVRAAGLIFTKVPPRSYILEGPAGKFFWHNQKIDDESWAHRQFGVLNISLMVEERPSDIEAFRYPLDANILKMLSEEHDKDTLMHMTEARLDEPVIMTQVNNLSYLIDGSHRLYKRNSLGLKDFSAFSVDYRALQRYKISCFRIEKNGGRTEVDLLSSILGR